MFFDKLDMSNELRWLFDCMNDVSSCDERAVALPRGSPGVLLFIAHPIARLYNGRSTTDRHFDFLKGGDMMGSFYREED